MLLQSDRNLKREPGLDLLRALAVTMVIVFHFSNETKDLLFAGLGRYGWMGVDLFFVLSGFLIGTQMFRPIAHGENLKLNQFFVRRFLRTLPNFIAILLIYFCFESLRERPQLPPLWKYLTFTQNIGLDRHSTGAFSHAWSLCVEEQFYILLPLLSLYLIPRATSRRLISIFSILLVGGVIIRSGIWQWVVAPLRHEAQGQFSSLYDKFIYYPTYARLDGLLIGVALALIKIFRPHVWRRLLENGLWSLVIGFALLIFAATLDKFSTTGAALTYPLIALGFGSLLIACLSPKLAISIQKIPGVSTLALLSYGIYLIQKLVFHSAKIMLPKIGIQPYTYLGFVITMAFCVLFALILYLVVERPFMKIRERLVSRLQ
ncbi:MAG: acyltransferase family protein [Bdellovibrio sp.]